MKFKKLIRTVSILLAISLLFVIPMSTYSADTSEFPEFASKKIFDAVSINEPSEAPEGMELITKKGYLAMFLNKTNAEFAIEDLRDNTMWYSNPIDREEDTIAKGSPKNELSSQLVVVDVNTEKNITKTRNSLIGSLNKKGLKVEVNDSGFTAIYDFPEYKYTIPVTFTLLEDSFKATIETDKIKEYGDLKVFTVGILPVFGAQNSDQEGYILLPDGSGSVIDFNNGRSNYATYRAAIYGRDYIFPQYTVASVAQNSILPVIGLQHENHGFVSIIEQGASMAYANARVAKQQSNYNITYFDFDIRASQNAVLGVDSSQRQVLIYDDGPIDAGTISVRYFPTGADKAGYAGMASVVREYLIKQYDMKANTPDDATLYINTVGSARKKTSVLGIRKDITIPITTFEQVGNMMSELNSLGVNRMAVNYSGWSDAEIRGKITTKSDYVGKIGGKNGLNELIKIANASDSNIYLQSELMLYYKSGGGISLNWDCAKDINLSSPEVKQFKANTFYPDSQLPERQLVSLFENREVLSKLVASLNKKTPGVGLSIGSFGNTQYSDYSEVNRKRMYQELLVDSLIEKESANIKMLASAPFMYALKNVSEVIDLSDSSSNYDVSSRSIPFVQMVLKGLVPYATTPINNSGSPTDRFLFCIESGSMLNYNLIGIDPAEIKDTFTNNFYSANYTYWKDVIVEQYKSVSELYDLTKGCTISDYIVISEGVVKTVYSNGVYTIVNRTDVDVDVDGITVAANDYVLEGGR